MTSMRDIKHRIANVSSTEQIIKAMDTIASTKLMKARTGLEGIRPIYNQLKDQVEDLSRKEEAATHTFFHERDKVKNSLYVVLTSDRGFAGSYNSNILNKTLEHMNKGKNEKILVVGSKGFEFFSKRKKNIIRKIVDVADAQMYYGTESLAEWMEKLYLDGEVDEIFICYTRFENVLNSEPRIERVLPVVMDDIDWTNINEKIYEPDLDTFIDHLIPLYLHMNLFRSFSESHTSEQAARMVSMDTAGKNASELIEDLTLQYNRQRQAAITQELNEIIGGSNI